VGPYKRHYSRETLDSLRTYVLNKYSSAYSKSKVLNFAKGFLRYMTTMLLDPRLQAFELFLDKPKTLKERKNVTERIVTKNDVATILAAIQETERAGSIDAEHLKQFAAFVLFGAYTGQRPYSTISKLKVGQFREALKHEKPTVHVEAAQDKIRMEHYVPLHPHLWQPLKVLCKGRESDESMFSFVSFYKWARLQKIPLSRCKRNFIPSDLRKFAEQWGDVIGWNESNRSYVLTHAVRGVEWSNYRHPLPEHVYDVYMKYWADVRLTT
jgi:integrase